MQGWGTVAGALFSALAFVAAVSLLWHEVRTRRRDDEDRVAGQARMVLISVFDAHENHDGGLVRMVNIHVRNHSASPIIDVEVEAVHSQPTADETEQDILTFEAEFIDPGHSDSELWLLRTPVSWTREVPLSSFFSTRIAFTDAMGLRWVRENRDEPRRFLSDGSRSLEAWRRN
jgi:hypothetical protein